MNIPDDVATKQWRRREGRGNLPGVFRNARILAIFDTRAVGMIYARLNFLIRR